MSKPDKKSLQAAETLATYLVNDDIEGALITIAKCMDRGDAHNFFKQTLPRIKDCVPTANRPLDEIEANWRDALCEVALMSDSDWLKLASDNPTVH